MFFVYKKSIFICVLIVVVAVAGACINNIQEVDNIESVATIALDAGHGGWDGGSVGKSGVKEAELNLKIVFMLKEKLESNHFKVVLTRDSENALGDTKLLDMKARAKIIKDAGCHAVVSIHMNKYPNKARRGAQVFYDDTGRGAEFGTLVQNTLNTYLNKKYCGITNFESLPGDFYITKCVPIPSIIVECGFLSNKEDEALLQTESYQEDLTNAISTAICSMFQNSSV